MKATLTPQRLTFAIAVCITCMVCLTRLSMAAGQVFNGLALLFGIILLYKQRDYLSFPEEAKGYCIAYGIFVLSTLPAALFSGDLSKGMHEFLQMWFWRYAVFLIILFCIRRRDYLVNMLTVFTAVFGIDCLVTLVQVLFDLSDNGRGWGLGGSQLGIASLMCIMMPLAVVILFDSAFERRLKKVSAFTLLCICIGLLCNKSRGSWLSNMVLVPFSAWRYVVCNKKFLGIIIGLFIAFSAFFASQPQYTARFASITNITTDRSNGDRIVVWEACIEMYKEHPIAGIGLGQFSKTYKTYYRTAEDTQGLNHAHNNFFHLLAETGTLGMAGLLYFTGYFVMTSFRRWKKDKNPYDLLILTTVLSYICIFGQVEYTMDLSSGVRIFWFILAIMMQLKALPQKDTFN